MQGGIEMKYEKPLLEIIILDKVDVITNSSDDPWYPDGNIDQF